MLERIDGFERHISGLADGLDVEGKRKKEIKNDF